MRLINVYSKKKSYEVQYPRFDNTNGLFPTQGFIDDTLFNGNDSRQANLWNKGNKLTKSTSLFTGWLF
jgi:hypothetical protein